MGWIQNRIPWNSVMCKTHIAVWNIQLLSWHVFVPPIVKHSHSSWSFLNFQYFGQPGSGFSPLMNTMLLIWGKKGIVMSASDIDSFPFENWPLFLNLNWKLGLSYRGLPSKKLLLQGQSGVQRWEDEEKDLKNKVALFGSNYLQTNPTT